MLAEVKNLNLSYLLLAQRLLRKDKAMGMSSMRISGKLADVILNLTIEQTERLAASSQLLCRLGFNDHAILSAISDKGSTAKTTASLITANAVCQSVDVSRYTQLSFGF
ncbi:flagellar transcriptional regulator FlhD [Paraburkholderia sediminicola]|uniref:Flagellar transcriptional regulator FlhD n=1 Tax=Paraburkholderia rhynchosiae TaxID=487049 RepID=A0ACC7NPB4_9BURK